MSDQGNETLDAAEELRLCVGIGGRVEKVRKGVLRWSKAETSAFLGMSRNKYDRFESGQFAAKGRPSSFRHDVLDLVRLGQAAGVSLTWLMTGAEGASSATTTGVPALAILEFAYRQTEEGDTRGAFVMGELVSELGLQQEFHQMQRARRQKRKIGEGKVDSM